MEHLRMRLTHEPITSDIIDMELIELKFIFDRCKSNSRPKHPSHTHTAPAAHHDHRDFNIIANYQPRGSDSINDQTHLFGKAEGVQH